MNVEKKQIDALDLQLTINVANDDYAALEKKRLNERRKTADFKGFRKGMVPMSLVQRVYGEQALVEAVNEVISKTLNDVINEDNLRVIGEPLTSEDQPEIDWKSGNDFVFKFDIATSPELNFEVSKDDKVTYYNIEISELAKQEMRENMLRQIGSLQESETAVADSFVIADLDNGQTKVEGAYISVNRVAGAAHDFFLGCKAGDRIEMNINEAFTDETDRAAMLKVSKEELAGINPQFTASIVNVKTFMPAEENQEAYNKLFGEGVVNTADDFDKAIESRLAANYTEEADYRFSKDARDYFVNKAAVELPEAFLKRWLLHINEGKFTMEEIEKEFPAFIEDYKWQMVRSYLMDKFEIKVSDEDMLQAAQAFASYQYASYGMSNVPVEYLEEAAKNILADERQGRQIEENVQNQKVVFALKDKVTLDGKAVSVEQFREIK